MTALASELEELERGAAQPKKKKKKPKGRCRSDFNYAYEECAQCECVAEMCSMSMANPWPEFRSRPTGPKEIQRIRPIIGNVLEPTTPLQFGFAGTRAMCNALR